MMPGTFDMYDDDDYVPTTSALSASATVVLPDHDYAVSNYMKVAEATNNIDDLRKLASYSYGDDTESIAAYEAYLKKAASLGDQPSLVDLGYHYESLAHGPNYEFAVERYSQAAEQGNIDAHRALAKLHFHGFGVPQDAAAALRHLDFVNNAPTDIDKRYLRRIEVLAAAESGDANAMYTIGLWYSMGEEYETDGWYEYNVERDTVRGSAWIEKAATHGSAVAAKHLRQIDVSAKT